MPCKKMSKHVSIPTFTIQYLMESGQGLTSNAGRKALGFTSNLEDEETIRKIIKILCEDELTVDRASRILADALKLLPFLGKLVID